MSASLFSRSLLIGWEVFDPDQSGWLSAEVPGCIHKDLLRHGRIPNPFYGRKESSVARVGKRNWCYRLRFSSRQAVCEHENVDLVFDGLDTVATFTLNGLEVLQSDNIFYEHRVPVRDASCVGENVLEITFGSVPEYVAQHRPLFKSPRNFNDPSGQCVRIRKQACQFVWDWNPRLVTTGIWRNVRLEGWRGARIESVRIMQNHGAGSVPLAIFPELAGAKEGVVFRSTVSLGAEEVAICQGTELTAVISNPQLWWPSGQADQPLYEVRVELLEGQSIIDTWVRRIGLRRIELDRGPDEFAVENSKGQPLNRFGFRVNGRSIFAKGDNWIPAHSFVHGSNRCDYAPLLESAVEANMNMIRLRGGGIYEHDWNVWHARFPVEHYETTRHRFCSEFGMQSYPSQEVAESFCPAGELNGFSPTFENHRKHAGGNHIIFEYLSRLFRFPKDYRATA